MNYTVYLRRISMLGLISFICFPLSAQVRQANFRRAGQLNNPVTVAFRQFAKLQAMSRLGYQTSQDENPAKARQLITSECSNQCGLRIQTPVLTLITFSGQWLDAQRVGLNWTTNAEITTDYFEVQRSLNPDHGFEGTGLVKGRGNSKDNVAYQFIDPNFENGYTYYRLKQVAYDGSFHYGQIIAIKNYRDILTVRATPNPSPQHQLTFEVSGAGQEKSVSISVYDGRGAVVYQHLAYGLDTGGRISLSGLSLQAGSYYVRVKTSQQQAVIPFIVAH